MTLKELVEGKTSDGRIINALCDVDNLASRIRQVCEEKQGTGNSNIITARYVINFLYPKIRLETAEYICQRLTEAYNKHDAVKIPYDILAELKELKP